MSTDKIDYDISWQSWSEMIDFSPAPKHRRRIILGLMNSLAPKNVLDIGCGNGRLLDEINKKMKIPVCGIDLSHSVIERNKRIYPNYEFHHLDIQTDYLDKKYDIVICSEVLEHLENVEQAIINISKMVNRYLILTLPKGKIFPIDKKVGHEKHFSKSEIFHLLEKNGFKIIKYFEWGFPFHTIYKYLINVFPNLTLPEFAEKKYGFLKKLFSTGLYYLFFLNFYNFGLQIVVCAERKF
jgi:SAM-dependent methyltransferase